MVWHRVLGRGATIPDQGLNRGRCGRAQVGVLSKQPLLETLEKIFRIIGKRVDWNVRSRDVGTISESNAVEEDPMDF